MSNGIVYRMSSAGSCPKKLSAIRLQVEPTEETPKWLDRAANEGNWHEERLVQELEDEGLKSISRQLEVTINLDTCHLVGHIDGMIYPRDATGNETKLIEIKSMSQYEFDRWMKGRFNEFPEYADQVTCYMAATELEHCLYVVKNRSSGYVDRSVINGYPSELSDIVGKIQTVEEYALKGELVPASYNVESLECRRCQFKGLCLPSPKEMNDVDEKVLLKALENYRIGKEMLKEGEGFKKAAMFVLESYCLAQPEQKYKIDNAVVSMVNVKETEIAYTRKAYSFCKVNDLKKESD